MTVPKLRLAQAAMAKRGTRVGDLCEELGITRQTLYRFVDPRGVLRADAMKLLKRKGRKVSPSKGLRSYRRKRRRLPAAPSRKRGRRRQQRS